MLSTVTSLEPREAARLRPRPSAIPKRRATSCTCSIPIAWASNQLDAAAAKDLEGLWQARLRFGPDLRGPLIVRRDAEGWSSESPEVAWYGGAASFDEARSLARRAAAAVTIDYLS